MHLRIFLVLVLALPVPHFTGPGKRKTDLPQYQDGQKRKTDPLV